ncbi:hypothetical protein ACFP7A_00510 [Sporolactobacillus kofuensis]|uniref:Uncharacterized protein n=1 Tax=Sporolactobacillus kofuensis TaxID=269672 RepID=A0ABW1WD66_9BACL|nr:hypothetical protein [Sporolactobacillus kofuensis]MCO7175614.1 hypothetical protein [Sporolactobacillus kofuensis]
MNKTGFISILSIFIVLTGFTLFYFLKIAPVQDDLAYSKKNIAMYKDTVALKQKQLKEQKKALAEKKKQAKEEELLGQKVDQSILPKDPRVEAFFSSAQNKAASMGISFVSIVKSNTDSGDSALSGTSSSSGPPDSSSSSSTGAKAATQSKADLNKLLTANTYQITLNSSTNAQLYAFVGYLETQRRLLVIDKVTSTRTSQSSNTGESSVVSSSDDSSSTAQKEPSAVQTNADGSDDQTSTSDSSQTDAQSQNDSSSSSAASEPSAQMVLTITLYSAK